MNKDSKIYIAGHNGLVGANLIKSLNGSGYRNLIVRTRSELDLTRQKDVEVFFEKERPEYVFLAAAKVGGILANKTYKAEFIYDNLAIALNVIHSSYKYDVKKLLNLGSSCIYPKLAPQPLKEEYLLTGLLESTNEPYAVAKIAAIKLCRYYNVQYDTNFISVMPTNLYGPGDNFNLETSHVLPGLLRKFHLAKLLFEKDYDGIREDFNENPFGYGFVYTDEIDNHGIEKLLENAGVTGKYVSLWGSGKAYREFLYIEDLAEGCIQLMEKNSFIDLGEIINIGSGVDIQICQLANYISEIVGFTGPIKYETDKPDGTPRKLLDVSRINEIGWSHTTDIKTGIQKLYDWYKRKN